MKAMTCMAAVLCAAVQSGAVTLENKPGEDATARVQKALDSQEKSVRLAPGDWIVRPLSIRRSNFEFVLSKGTRLLAKKGEYHGIIDKLVNVESGVHDVVIRGEGDSTFEMNLRDYQDRSNYTFSEWRHTLMLQTTTNVTVRGLSFVRSGGDGIAVNGAVDTLIEDCRMVDCNRLGMGVVNCDGLTIRRCRMADNNGTPPVCGIDLEPNYSHERISRVLIEDCEFSGHRGSGVLFHLVVLKPGSHPVSAVVRNCRAHDNQADGFRVTACGDRGPVKGTIRYENCVSERNGSADLFVNQKAEDGVRIETSGCNFRKIEEVEWIKPQDAAVFNAHEVRAMDTKPGLRSSGWVRLTGGGSATFLQPVETAGTYRVRFDVKAYGADASATVVEMDASGTPLGTFNVGPDGLDHVFKTNGRNCRQFVVRTHGLVKVESSIPGLGVRADRHVQQFVNNPQPAYRFRVPKDCRSVRVEIRPDEPVEGVLLDETGREKARVTAGRGAFKVLLGLREPSSEDVVWRLNLGLGEDGYFRIAAPCPPVAEFVPVNQL